MSNEQIKPSENANLYGVTNSYGRALRIYDDGFGPLWVYQECFGPVGVVRAKTWENAYSICEDVIFDDATEEDYVDALAICGMPLDGSGGDPEGYCFRPDGTPTDNGLTSHIGTYDLNGSCLSPLTGDLVIELGLKLDIH